MSADRRPAGGAPQVVAAVERIDVLVGQRIPRDGVDGEVASSRCLLDAMAGSPSTWNAVWPRPRLRFSAGQRDVDRAELEHRERPADRLDASDRRQQRRQRVAGDAEHFQVQVLGGPARAADRARSRRPPAPGHRVACRAATAVASARGWAFALRRVRHRPMVLRGCGSQISRCPRCT